MSSYSCLLYQKHTLAITVAAETADREPLLCPLPVVMVIATGRPSVQIPTPLPGKIARFIQKCAIRLNVLLPFSFYDHHQTFTTLATAAATVRSRNGQAIWRRCHNLFRRWRMAALRSGSKPYPLFSCDLEVISTPPLESNPIKLYRRCI